MRVRDTQTGVVNSPALLWLIRAAWLALPFTLSDQLDAATAGSSPAMRWAVSIMFWALWVAALGSSLVPLPSTLTVLRMVAPMAPVAALVTMAFETPGVTGWLGLAVGLACAVLVMAAPVGDWFVDGASYGDERRFALKAPASLLVGPLEAMWLLAAIPLPAGVLLLADRRWVPGAVVVLLGLLSTPWGFFACRQLARRWAVFVPAGITLVDEMALAQPVLFPASSIARLGPARQGTEALDLTVGAPGLVLQLTLGEPVELVPSARGDEITEATAVDAVLIVPSRPATLLAEAERRGLAVGAVSEDIDEDR